MYYNDDRMPLYVAFIYFLVLSFFLVLLCCFCIRLRKPWMEFNGKNLLLITAHPDDECMFFGPLIADALRVTSSFSLLCFTKGNFYNKGDERKQELIRSCKILGITNVTILENNAITDDPQVMWNEDLVSDVVLRYIGNNKIDGIITFDDYGVSGHKNHISIYKAMRRLIDNRNLSRRVAVYTLDSVKLFRKYIFIFDLLWSVLTRKLVFVSGLKTVRKSQPLSVILLWLRPDNFTYRKKRTWREWFNSSRHKARSLESHGRAQNSIRLVQKIIHHIFKIYGYQYTDKKMGRKEKEKEFSKKIITVKSPWAKQNRAGDEGKKQRFSTKGLCGQKLAVCA